MVKKNEIELANVESRILTIRGRKVLLDVDLAELYETPTKALIQAVKRNLPRFPADFMFQLTEEEYADLRSQIVTSRWGGRRYLPFAFTEQGVAMLSSVLRSGRAIEVNIEIMRAFVRLRQILVGNRDLARQLAQLEKELRDRLDVHEVAIVAVLQRVMDIIDPPELAEPAPKRRMGFKTPAQREAEEAKRKR